MYKTLINYHGRKIYSSLFKTEKEAIEYAERMRGIVAVIDPKNKIIWER
jgi:hypothetical protein